jgi:nucleotide-binding universal stress UspA family protein
VIKRAVGDKQLRLYVLKVQPTLPSSLFVPRAMIASHHEAKSKEALIRSRRLLSKSRLRAEVAVRIGEPADMILKFARRSRCAEIVMGSSGRGSLKGLILGSITTKLIHAARVPITVVRDAQAHRVAE